MTEDSGDLTKDGVVFAAWETPVTNSDLSLKFVRFDAEKEILKAAFKDYATQQRISFTFANCWTFRVLDERGLTELWNASSKTPRPAQTTFMVRGHTWQLESSLEWLWNCDAPYFSYMIATNSDCLEVIAPAPPDISMRPG